MTKIEKKKLTAKGFAGIEKERPTYGPMRDKLEVVQDLPPVGSLIRLFEVTYLDRTSYRMSEMGDVCNAVREFWSVAEGCTTARGVHMLFEVMSYSRGIENPLDGKNLMYLKCVYPKHASKYNMTTTFPTLQVAVGALRVKYYKEDDEGVSDEPFVCWK